MKASESRTQISAIADPLKQLTEIELMAVNAMFHFGPPITRDELARAVLALRNAGLRIEQLPA